MIKKKFVSSALTVALMSSTTAPYVATADTNEDIFLDVKEGQTFFKHIDKLARAGIINGYPDGTYRPDTPLSKIQAAILFAKSLRLPIEEVDPTTFPFKKVSPNYKYAPFLATLYRENVITDKNFDPEQPLTREEMALWLKQAFNLKAIDNKPVQIPDSTDINQSFKRAVLSLYHHNITKGTADGSFDPQGIVNRGQFAIFLYRSLTASNIKGVEDLNEIYISLNTRPDLPEAVNVLLMDETIEERKVMWDLSSVEFNEQGTLTIEGLVERSIVTVSITVHVGQNPVEMVDSLDSVSYTIGEPLSLPGTVNVTFKDGTSEAMTIAWEQIEITQPGNYTVNGLVPEIEQPVATNIFAENPLLQVMNVHVETIKSIELQLNVEPRSTHKLLDKSMYEVSTGGQRVEVFEVRYDSNKNAITLTTAFPLVDYSGFVTVKKGVLEEDQTINFNVKDDEAPTVTSIYEVGPKQIQLQLSEPMDVKTENGKQITNKKIIDSFDLYKGNNNVSSISSYDNGQTFIITFDHALKKGINTLQIGQGLTDFGKQSVEKELYNFEYEEVTSTPKITRFDAENHRFVTVSFGLPIKLIVDKTDLLESIYFYKDNKKVYPTSIEAGSYNQLNLYFSQGNELTDESLLFIESDVVKDFWGNENVRFYEKIKIENDQTAPALSSVNLIEESEANSENILLNVSFNEPVNLTTTNMNKHFIFLNSSGSIIPIKDVKHVRDSKTDKYAVKLDTTYGNLAEDKYTLYALSIKDLFGNEAASLSKSFTAKSLKTPGDFKGFVLGNSDEEIIFSIDFGQNMTATGDYSIHDLSMYELNYGTGAISLAELANESGIQVNLIPKDNSQSLDIFIKYAEDVASAKWKNVLKSVHTNIVNKNISEFQLIVGKVADENGITTQGFYNTVSLEAKGSFSIANALSVNPYRIKVELEDELDNFSKDDFVLFADTDFDRKADKDEIIDYVSAYELNDGRTTITFELDSKISGDGRYNSAPLYFTASTDLSTQNRYGQFLEDYNYIKVEDGIPASVISEEVSVEKAENKINTALIRIPFTDSIDSSTISRLTFEVNNESYEISSIETSDTTILLYVDLAGAEPDDLIGSYVKQVLPFTDQDNNMMQNLSIKIQ